MNETWGSTANVAIEGLLELLQVPTTGSRESFLRQMVGAVSAAAATRPAHKPKPTLTVAKNHLGNELQELRIKHQGVIPAKDVDLAHRYFQWADVRGSGRLLPHEFERFVRTMLGAQ